MKNNDLFPFERNRYYTGKMLTSGDFDQEQTYMNNKRRFLNQMVTGAGILCGLGVVSLDDQSIIVESGAAIDHSGREILVESSVVKKLSAIEGFEKLSSNRVSLCIRYQESESTPVYAVNRQAGEREYEYNRMEEGYELFLEDTDQVSRIFQAETEFFTGGTLFEDSHYAVRLRMPATICKGRFVKLEVVVQKLSEEDVKLYYEGTLQTPALFSVTGEQEQHIFLENVSLPRGAGIVKEYWMRAQEEVLPDTGVMLKPKSARALINGTEAPVREGLNVKVSISDISPEKLALRETGKISLELKNMNSSRNFVPLAEFVLVRTETAYVIEKVEENKGNHYIPTLREECQRREFEQYFAPRMPFYETGKTEAAPVASDSGSRHREPSAIGIETGIVEIPLGSNARRGDVCYSGEIMHGLGKGNVYVEVGYEYLEEDLTLKRNARATVYGNPDLFPNGEMSQPAAETAVKVLNDKGSFVVAVRLLRDVDFLVLTYRWAAVKMAGEEKSAAIDPGSNKSISAVTPTVVLGTKETYFFQVKFHNMKECSVSYELTEPGSGEVSPDGIYTAPSREGVYELKIYCTDMPLICTYAYAIVKRKSGIEKTQQ